MPKTKNPKPLSHLSFIPFKSFMVKYKKIDLSPLGVNREMDQATETAILKNRVVETLGKLSKVEIQNVLKFSEFLLFEVDKKRNVPSRSLDPKKDPILRVIGIAEVEPFADEIDQELYGD